MKKTTLEPSQEVKELLETEHKESKKEENIEEKDTQKHMEIVDNIQKAIDYLNDLDNYFNDISEKQSENDNILNDLLHFVELEDYDFTPNSALKFVKLLKKCRKERRKLSDEWEIKQMFMEQKNKVNLFQQRKMLLNNVYKKEKNFSSRFYKYRVYSPNDIKALITSKRGRKKRDINEN